MAGLGPLLYQASPSVLDVAGAGATKEEYSCSVLIKGPQPALATLSEVLQGHFTGRSESSPTRETRLRSPAGRVFRQPRRIPFGRGGASSADELIMSIPAKDAHLAAINHHLKAVAIVHKSSVVLWRLLDRGRKLRLDELSRISLADPPVRLGPVV